MKWSEILGFLIWDPPGFFYFSLNFDIWKISTLLLRNSKTSVPFSIFYKVSFFITKILEEKDTLEIYKLKSQINSLIRETSNCKGENENLLNEIQSLVLSESSVFNKPSPFLEKENDLMAQMTLLFSDLDVFFFLFIMKFIRFVNDRKL